jgi:hypothetical protein
MGRRSRTSALRRAALKAWNEKADQWDGEAVVFNPWDKTYEPATDYQANIACPMMAWFDRLPPWDRRRIANSVDGG